MLPEGCFASLGGWDAAERCFASLGGRLWHTAAPMRLFALRGANTVPANEAAAILSATDELMRELMERNELEPDAMVSCIFTLTDDLNAEFPAVAARNLGLSRVPLLCSREVPVPGSLPRVIRVLVHYYAAEEHEPRHVYLRGRARAPGRPRVGTIGYPGPACRSSSQRASAAFPSTRWPPATTWARTWPCSPPTSRASRRCPQVVEAAGRAMAGANRYPDPSYSPLRRALADRYGIPPERIALGNGSCDILLRAGEALLEPGAEVVYAWPAFSVYPHLAAASGARAIEVPLDDEDRHDLDAIAAEITVATRLVLICNPNNPTSTALGLEEIEAFLKRVPAHVCVILDEAYCEFALALGDTYASLELLRRYPNLVLLRTFSKVYGLAAPARRVRAVRHRGLPDRGRPGPPAVLPERGRAGGGRRGAAPPGRGRAARDRRRSPSGWTLEDGRARAGAVGRASRTRTSSGCTCPRRSRRPTWWPDCETGACSSGPAPRSGERARCA